MARPPQDAPPDDIDMDEPEAALPEPDQAGLFDDAAPERLKSGVEAIRAAWATLPNGPGVYRMLGQGGEVLYVGKARSLKKRVASYTRGVGHTNRIARMIASTSAMEFVTTATETEALLLETNYIKQLKPRFNVLMRDDKSFPYILLTGDHAAPQLCKHRGARNRKGEYFGPFASAQAVGRTINALQRAFLIRTCSDSYFENRTRPCLLHQIKRCAGPCTGEVSGEEYAALVREAKDFLSGRSVAVKEQIAREMQAASEDLEFERAARYRDRLAALSAIQSTQDINPRETEEADVFAVHEEAGQFIIEAFFFRAFQNWGNRAFYPRADRTLTPAEVLDAFLGQFYDERPAARLVLLSHEIENRMLLAEALSTRAGRKVEIAVPRRGEKKDLVDHAATNAREALSRRLADAASQKKLIDAMAETFSLPRPPRRIDVFDNSHIMGTNAVGAMIVAGEQGFLKTHYRTFNIRSEDLTPGDDYGMMREVLGRRFARLQKEAPRDAAPVDRGIGESSDASLLLPPAGEGPAGDEGMIPALIRPSASLGPPSPVKDGRRDAPAAVARTARRAGDEDPAEESFPSWPDLVLIDGGKGQLDAAKGVLDELGVTGVPLVGVAKGADRDAGRETFFIEGRAPFRLPPRDPVLYFVQRLRDEAHRFAIGAHRAKRRRELVKNPLDEIAGIGPRRKRALLLHFGTAKAVGGASFEDLMKCPGVNEATARAVYAFFHEGAA